MNFDPCEKIKLTLIANAAALLQCTRTESSIIPLPGTERVVAIGTPARITELLAAAPASADNPSTAGAAESELVADLSEFTERSIRDHADFCSDLMQLSRHGLSTKQAKIIRKEIYDTIDVRVRNAVKAALAAPVAQSTAGAANIRPSDDDLWDQTLRERDHNADMADRLAEAIGKHFGIEIGEHSNMNCPWHTALDWIENATTVAELRLAAPAAQAPTPQWISVEDRLPDAENEDTSRDVMVSDSLFIRGIAIDGGEAIGLGDYSPDAHVPDAGWRCYGGDYDFMHFAKVTHWMKPGRPAAPEQSVLRPASKEGGADHG